MQEIRMTRKELKHVDVLALVVNGKMTMSEGAKSLGITKRHLRRLRRRYESGGAEALVHQSRGKKGRNAFPEELRAKIVELLYSQYYDFGPTFAAEKISKDLKRKISKEKIRQLQIREGLWVAKKKREKKYHPRRARRSRVGELIQIDGSEHDWLEGRGAKMTLVSFVDDATSETIARFMPKETTEGYMKLTKEYIEKKGRPRALYSDKHGIFRQNHKGKHLIGKMTQYGRALKELGIELICAHSPQAKGRVERSFGTHQDRLVKELRLAGINTLEEANKFLEGYLEEHNKRFSVKPLSKEDGHQEKKEIGLNKALSIREQRTLSKGLSFQYKNKLYQLKNQKNINRLQNKKVEIIERLDGRMIVELDGAALEVELYDEYRGEMQKTLGSKEIGSLWTTPKKRTTKKNHPWR